MLKRSTAIVVLVLMALHCFIITGMAQEKTVQQDTGIQNGSQQYERNIQDNQAASMPENHSATRESGNNFQNPAEIPSYGNQPQRGMGGRGGMGNQGEMNGQGGFRGDMVPPDMPMGGFQVQNETAGHPQNTDPVVTESMTVSEFVKEYFTPIASMVLLAFAFIFVIFYKRKTF